MGLLSRPDELKLHADEASGVSSYAADAHGFEHTPVIPRPARLPREALVTKSGPVALPSRAEEVEPGRDSLSSLRPPIARFAQYDVLGRLAVGGMAEIYLGREAVEGGALRHVAIKVLRRQGSSGEDAYFEELFLREGRTAAQLAHPNICHTYAFGNWGGHFYIAMEWVEGVSLAQLVQTLASRGQGLDPCIAASIAAQVAAALDYAHRARDAWRRPLAIVHRDVNPQNIMLRYDGAVKLLDFGVAQVADPRGDSRSATLKGKFGYMPPEQLRQESLDGRADVFALGVCLYEMVTGTRLYKRDSVRETVRAVLEEPAPSLRERDPALASELDGVLARALAKDPKQRFASAADLQAALETFLARSGEVVSARRISALLDGLYPSGRRDGANVALFTGPDVAMRLSAIGAGSTSLRARSAAPSRAPGHGLLRGFVLAVVAALTVLLLAWAWPSAEPSSLPAARVISPSAAPPRQASAAARELAPVVPTPAFAPIAPRVESRGSASGVTKPEDNLAKRRRRSPGFVSDPGF